MIECSMVKPYLHYVIPATIAFTLSCIYAIVDGIFVGNYVGDAGLAGINVAYPLYALIYATGTGIGMGGAIIASVREGAGNVKGSRRAMGHTITLLAIASVIVMTFLLIFARPACGLLGGSGATLNEATSYITVLALATPFQLMVSGCLPLIRNRGHVKYAMCASVAAGVTNVILDYVFIVLMGCGTAGAGAATALAQLVSFTLIFGFFCHKNERPRLADFKLNTELVVHTIKLGIAPLGLTFLPQVTIITINISAMHYGGETAVAAYAVVAYAACVVSMLIQGVADGSQPLISKQYGAGHYKVVRKLRNTNYAVALSIGVVGLVVCTLLRFQIAHWFGASAAATSMIGIALPLICFAYLFFGFTHVSSSYFYAIDNHRSSTILVYGESALVVAFVVSMGALFGLMGVWSAIAVEQITLCVITFCLLMHASSRYSLFGHGSHFNHVRA